MVFNLKKYSTSLPTVPVGENVLHGLDDIIDTYEEKPKDIKTEDVIDTALTPEQGDILQKAQNIPLIDEINKLLADPRYEDIAPTIRSRPDISALLDSNDLAPLRQQIDEMKGGPMVDRFKYVSDRRVTPEDLTMRFNRIRTEEESKENERMLNQQREQTLRMQVGASKHAQVETPNTDEMPKAQFVQNYLSSLMSYAGDKGQNDVASEEAKSKILSMVSPALQNDANDAIEEIQSLNSIDQARGKQILELVFDSFIAPATQETEQPVMSTQSQNQNDHIIKFDLKDHIETSDGKQTKEAEDKAKMIKTARMHSNNAYLLYGPSEKRVCPKLRGKNVGDVVSEYICRHHCLDGIVIDDNKTVCGEAIWRSNAMDKFSREYVDEDGKTVGGYLNKRFEINRNVPEETRMRLKPGEIRKPRPASMGNIESRMQDMRNKEGEKRGYKPDTNTGEPFVWDKDVDQNNVEATQAERDRREESMGHKTVQYTNKTEQENKPEQTKKGFNLKQYKTAGTKGNYPFAAKEQKYSQYTDEQLEYAITDADEAAKAVGNENTDQGWYADDVHTIAGQIRNREQAGKWRGTPLARLMDKLSTYDTIGLTMDNFTDRSSETKSVVTKTAGFNLNTYKTAQCPVPCPEDGAPIEPVAPKRRRWNFNLKKHKEAQMTGPRGPIGEDNPASDDLGLSPDYDPLDDEFSGSNTKNDTQVEVQLNPGDYEKLFGDDPTYRTKLDQELELLKKELRIPEISYPNANERQVNFELVGNIDPGLLGDMEWILGDLVDKALGQVATASSVRHMIRESKCKPKWTGGKYPYAICNKTSPKSEDPEKFERCVKHVKDGKDVKDLESEASKKKI